MNNIYTSIRLYSLYNKSITISQITQKYYFSYYRSKKIISELLKNKYLVPAGYDKSSGGRKPSVFELNKTHNLIITCIISDNITELLLCYPDGTIIDRFKKKLDLDTNWKYELYNFIYSFISRFDTDKLLLLNIFNNNNFDNNEIYKWQKYYKVDINIHDINSYMYKLLCKNENINDKFCLVYQLYNNFYSIIGDINSYFNISNILNINNLRNNFAELSLNNLSEHEKYYLLQNIINTLTKYIMVYNIHNIYIGIDIKKDIKNVITQINNCNPDMNIKLIGNHVFDMEYLYL